MRERVGSERGERWEAPGEEWSSFSDTSFLCHFVLKAETIHFPCWVNPKRDIFIHLGCLLCPSAFEERRWWDRLRGEGKEEGRKRRKEGSKGREGGEKEEGREAGRQGGKLFQKPRFGKLKIRGLRTCR